MVASPEVTTGAADVPVAAAAAASGGDDLGFLDVQVSSAQEIQQEQSQQNKMANIMGAFGSAPAAAPMVTIKRNPFLKIYLILAWYGRSKCIRKCGK